MAGGGDLAHPVDLVYMAHLLALGLGTDLDK